MKAVWNNTVIAESNATVVVEGNHYFPLASVNQSYCQPQVVLAYYLSKTALKLLALLDI